MPRDIYNDTIISADSNGVPTVLMASVLVTVWKAGTQTAATIYTTRDQPTQQPNPFEATNGIVRFWADQGEYDVHYHDNLLRIADQTVGWNSMPGGAAGVTPPMLAPGATPPPGSIFQYIGATEPTGYKFCNGQGLSKTTYASLYTALGGGSSPFGTDPNNSGNFLVPDMRSRIPIGAGPGGGLTSRPLGQYGGGTLDLNTTKLAEESHKLTATEMPSHAHTTNAAATGIGIAGAGTGMWLNDPTHAHGPGSAPQPTLAFVAASNTNGNLRFAGGTAFYGQNMNATAGAYTGMTLSDPGHAHGVSDPTHAHTVNASGGDGFHNNIQPYLALNYIIRDGT